MTGNIEICGWLFYFIFLLFNSISTSFLPIGNILTVIKDFLY